MERLSEIQYQNRVLLRKMLQIDMKPSQNVGTKKKMLRRNNSQAMKSAGNFRPQSAKFFQNEEPKGLNSYNSLNRANRIRSLAKIIDENKVLLDKLQNTKSTYSMKNWEQEYTRQQQYRHMIQGNGDRYCKNPYFLHSICTESNPNEVASEYRGLKTISEYQPRKSKKGFLGGSK